MELNYCNKYLRETHKSIYPRLCEYEIRTAQKYDRNITKIFKSLIPNTERREPRSMPIFILISQNVFQHRKFRVNFFLHGVS